MAKSGIAGYGVYIPRFRLKTADIAGIWGSDKESASAMKGEKAVAGLDEDATTMAAEASKSALRMAGVPGADIGAIYVGSESHPYVVKSTSSIVAEVIEATPHLSAADLEFACRAGTAGMQIVMGLLDAGRIKYGLAVGSDTAQGKPGNELEYTAASGACACLIGKKNVIATINDTCSYTTDTPDFWRREGEEFPRHGGRFTGAPAYFTHVLSATKALLEKTKTTVKDYDHFVFHQPNAKFPLSVAKMLGIEKEKVLPGLMVPVIGNTYSASSMIGLAAVLDIAKAGDRIIVTSFGSGAGSDSFSITMTDLVESKKRGEVAKYLNRKTHIDYALYTKFRGKLKGMNG